MGYIDIEFFVSSCSKLKHIRSSGCFSTRQWLSIQSQNLEQLCIIYSREQCSYQDKLVLRFMQSVSARGGLVHVVMYGCILHDDGVIALVGNSPNLLACHISAGCILKAPSSNSCKTVTLEDMTMMAMRRFSDRKLFTC